MTDNIIDAKDRFRSKPALQLKPTGFPEVDGALKRASVRNPLFVRDWRYAKGMSLDELAFRIEVGKGHLVRIEKGERQVTAAHLAKIASALGIEVGDLFRAPPQQTGEAS